MKKKPVIFRYKRGWACVSSKTYMGYGINPIGAYMAWQSINRMAGLL